MPKGKRLARNIYADAYGIRIIVSRHGRREEPRYPLGTPLDELRRDRDALIDELEGTPKAPTRTGTLAADIARALATIPAGHHHDTVRGLLDHWIHAPVTAEHGDTTFGRLPRAAVTPLQIRTQLAVFRPRFKPKTVKELRRVLGWVYTTLDGPDARNPVRAVKAPRVTYDDPRGLDYALIDRILAAMPARGRPADGVRPTVNLSKLRLAVMAATGLHQIEVARLTPPDVDLVHRRIWIGPRVKGAGAEGAWHRLTNRGVAALRAFVTAKAFGPFDTRGVARVFTRAVQAARRAWEADPTTKGQPWPAHADVRPYDLRHSLGTAVYLATGDIRAAQAMLRHRHGSTTARYTRAGVSRQVDKAVDALNRASLPIGATNETGQDGPKGPPTASTHSKHQRPGRRRS